MRYLIDKEFIKKKAALPTTFQKGSSLYRLNNVYGLTGYGSASIKTTVRGSQHYRLFFEFDSKGFLIEWGCSCPASKKYKGLCKHTVAALLKLEDRQNDDDSGPHSFLLNNSAKKDANDVMEVFRSYRIKHEETETEKLIKGFSSVNKNRVYKTLTLEMYINIREDASPEEPQAALSLRLGDERLYVVQRLSDFLSAIKENTIFELNKNFIYDPRIHTFTDGDQFIIHTLAQIWEDDLSYRQTNNLRLTGPGIFNRKHLTLSAHRWDLLWDILKVKGFKIGELNQSVEGTLLDAVPPIEIETEEPEDGLKLILKTRQRFIPLVENGAFVYDKEATVYRVPFNERPLLDLLYKCFKTDDTFVIPEHMTIPYLIHMHPVLENMIALELPLKLEKKLVRPPLEKRAFIDFDGSAIILSYKCMYGSYEAAKNNAAYEAADDDTIIVRDLKAEEELVTFFSDPKFLKTKTGYRIVHESDQYAFIHEDINTLRKLAKLYMTKEFHTCLHMKTIQLSYDLSIDDSMNWLDFKLNIDGIDESELVNILEAYQLKMRYYRRDNGEFLDLTSGKLGILDHLTDRFDLKVSDFKNGIQLPASTALSLKDQLSQVEVEEHDNVVFEKLVKQIEKAKEVEHTLPESLENILRNYQKLGFKWLSTLSSLQMGGVLADDMGLGKTLQVLSYILHEVNNGMEKPVLIIAPTSLVYNWIAEVEKFTPMLKAHVVRGTAEERQGFLKDVEGHQLLITSYHLMRRDIEHYQQHRYHSIILDEAQHIKNESSKGAKAVKQLDANHRFAMTGTPMENHLGELWSIFDFVLPGHLGSRNWFRNQFINPITKEQDIEKAMILSNMIKPFLLRRLKSDVLQELPDKIENQVFIEMTEEQKKLYIATVKSIRGEIMAGIDQNGIQKMRIQILAGLTRLRQICCHPAVYLEDYEGDSGKFEALEELMEELKESGHRPLIFSQFTSVLKRIKERLVEKGMDIYYLDGSTPAQDRMELVKTFNGGDGEAFLISLKAGGTGLNLTGADTVIHFDPWWNPAVEDQATDRAHRIGQEKTVHVMKLICKGTIEEKILDLQKRKKKLIDQVILPGETMIGQMSVAEVEELLKYDG